MNDGTRNFLITTELTTGKSFVEDLGTDVWAAMDRLKQAEHALDTWPVTHEVALLGAHALEVIQLTHSSYFYDWELVADGAAR